MSGQWICLHLSERIIDGQAITFYAQAGNDAFRNARQIGKMPERFALMDIGNMYFYEGNRHARERIAQRHAGVRQSARIDDDGVDAFGMRLMDTVDQRAFVVALKRRQAGSGVLGLIRRPALDIGKRRRYIYLWLPYSQ